MYSLEEGLKNQYQIVRSVNVYHKYKLQTNQESGSVVAKRVEQE